MIASPFWLAAVEQNPELATQPVGTGPFVVDSYSPRESLEVSRNPDYWMTDADGNQLPYLDSITFRVIEDSETAAEALQSGDIDMMSTSAGGVITEIQDAGDDFTVDAPGPARRDVLRDVRPRQGRTDPGRAGALPR